MSRFDVRPIVNLGDGRATGRRIHDGQYLTVQALLRRLYGLDQPGVVLADEVGLGKTYVALGVVAWLLHARPRARVLVLTNSRTIVRAWRERWEAIDSLGWDKPAMHELRDYGDYAEVVKDPAFKLGTMSYESLKQFRADWDQVRIDLGAWLFEPRHHPGIRLNSDTRACLKRALRIRANGRARALQRAIPASEGRQWWAKHFDPETRQLFNAEQAASELEDLELKYQSTHGGDGRRYKFDLVVIDEAHRFDSVGRQRVIDYLLKGNANKFLHVTATPFALSVTQLERLLGTFGAGLRPSEQQKHERALATIGLRDFERAVGLNEPVLELSRIERQLRRWIVRRTWDEEAHGSSVKERHTSTWRLSPDAGVGFIATLALERAIAELHRSGGQTHIASRRTSLCSSWSSALASLDEANFGRKRDSAERFRSVAVNALRPVARADSPKVQETAERIAALVRAGKKILLFAERKETLLSIERHLNRELKALQDEARRKRERLIAAYRAGALPRLRSVADDFGGEPSVKALLAALAGSDRESRLSPSEAERRARKWLKDSLNSAERLGWLADSFEGGRTIRAVEVYDGSRGNDSTVNRFNLPGTPWVLLCSRKAQESIDLHVECNTIVLFDPVWNPAAREQRIGRVQRIGSRFHDVEVIDVVTTGTYEEYTYRRAMARARMMRVLLGARKWLDADVELGNPDAYRINLSPRAALERELVAEARG